MSCTSSCLKDIMAKGITTRMLQVALALLSEQENMDGRFKNEECMHCEAKTELQKYYH